MSKAIKLQTKHLMEHQIDKIACVMHNVGFADGPLEGKYACELSHGLFSKGVGSEHIANRTSNRATRACKIKKLKFSEPSWGQKSDSFDRKCLKAFFKNVLATAARSTFFEKV